MSPSRACASAAAPVSAVSSRGQARPIRSPPPTAYRGGSQRRPTASRSSRASTYAGSGLTASRYGCGQHRRQDLVRPGEGKIFTGKIRRQDLDHRLVLDPDLHDVEGAAVAPEAFPAGALGNLFNRLCVGRDAEREVGCPIGSTGFPALDKAPADRAVRLQLGPRRIDFDARSVLV